ncbi:hypothetical protein MPL3356_350076 [Mesorhizobium plurifarium]|uniref:Uncharacterized protein n=1 Tax=Mesorhizobium plurifarium TaxID=69974 RepID=A0A090E2R8_MESPL|nr:hypothetical protein MPL3356_350076 [Mesorhizobium plurifarium]
MILRLLRAPRHSYWRGQAPCRHNLGDRLTPQKQFLLSAKAQGVALRSAAGFLADTTLSGVSSVRLLGPSD